MLQANPLPQFKQHLEACARTGAQSPKMKKLVEVLRAHFQVHSVKKSQSDAVQFC